MRKFFTKQRIYIVLLGIILFVVFGFASSRQHSSSFWEGILGGLAASSLTISFTAAVVDWLFERERNQRTKSAYNNAVKVLLRAQEDFISYVVEALGFEAAMRGLLGTKVKNKYSNTEPGMPRIMKYLDAQDFKDFDSIKKNVDLNKLEKLIKSTDNLIQTIDNVITLYGYALPVDLKNDLLVYRQHVTDFLEMHAGEHDTKPDTTKNRIIYTAMRIHEPLKTFNIVLKRSMDELN